MAEEIASLISVDIHLALAGATALAGAMVGTTALGAPMTAGLAALAMAGAMVLVILPTCLNMLLNN